MTGVEHQLTELMKSATPVSDGVAFEDVARRVRRGRSLRWSVMGSAAVVAVIAVVISLVGTSGDDHASPPATTPSVDLTGSIPWINAPARPYQPPTAPSTPPAATDARPCTTSDVAARFTDGTGAGGHSETYVTFRNTSRSTCVLKGYPRVTATEPGRPDVTATNGSFFPSGRPANMPPGRETLLGLETDTYCNARPGGGGGGPPYHHIAIRLPGGGTVALHRASDGFDVACGLHLTGFFVAQAEQPEPHDPLSDLRASLETPRTIRAGGTLVYVADVRNPTDRPISLIPCPGYIEWTTGTPTPAKQTYALNCRPVGAIAAHGSVRFEMRLRIPANTPAGPIHISWTLFASHLATAASATVRVAGR